MSSLYVTKTIIIIIIIKFWAEFMVKMLKIGISAKLFSYPITGGLHLRKTPALV